MIDERKTLDKKIDNVKLKEIIKKQKLQEKGITLIALVVTIIILLILAGVTLNIALSDNGLFSKTKESAEKYKEAQREEEKTIIEVEKQFRPLVTTVTELAKENIEAKDSLGNLITIPKGFKIVEGSTVQDGIVIEDKDENQFVWIPVSNIDGDNNAETESNSGDLITIDGDEKVEITLGRYSFNYSNGASKLVQRGSECSVEDKKFFISGSFKENTRIKEEEGYAKAKNLKEFVESVKKNHGYYIARYEAGEGEEGKPVSKPGTVWIDMTQKEASEGAKKMYEGNENYYESDLVNSYAWDTTIVYIQAMGNINYAKANRGENKEKKETGETGDEECHIYDMAGNASEYTTESSMYIIPDYDYCCVTRGGNCFLENFYTAFRNNVSPANHGGCVSFRTLLYLK